MSTHSPSASPVPGGPTRAAVIVIVTVAVLVAIVSVVVRATTSGTASWRAGYGDAPLGVQTQAVAAAREASGWTGKQVPDAVIGTMLGRACTDLHEGATTRQRDTAALTYLARKADDLPLKALAQVPEAVAAGVAVRCPDA